MKLRVDPQDGGDYTVVAIRTLANEQPLAGFTDVPREDVQSAALETAEQMRGEAKPTPLQPWSEH